MFVNYNFQIMQRDNVINKVLKQVAEIHNLEENDVFEIVSNYIDDVYSKLQITKNYLKVIYVMIPYFGKFILLERRYEIKKQNANIEIDINNFTLITFKK